MKIKSLLLAVLLLAGVVVAPAAQAATENPKVESFTFSPQEIELTGAETVVNFELVVAHPSGIEDSSTLLTLINSQNASLVTYLNRTSTNSSDTKVTFKGKITLPRNIPSGVYTFSASSVKNNSSAGYQRGTGLIEPTNVRTLVGAEGGLLVRSGGDLNFEYSTFFGPTYDSKNTYLFKNKLKYNLNVTPIWKVGETYNPNDYFELQVPGLELNVETTTPEYCSTDGKKLNLLKEGGCAFSVRTIKNKDYTEKRFGQTVTITSARIKPDLVVNKVANQDIKDLGKSIEIGQVYSSSQGFIFPISSTPAVCSTSGFYVKLISAGTCKFTYQSDANADYLASNLYTVTFDISKDGLPIVVPTPVATPTPSATPTPTPKPIVKKTISCVKGKKTIKKTAISPKCPAGYKLKK
jgi:hypothetical protein